MFSMMKADFVNDQHAGYQAPPLDIPYEKFCLHKGPSKSKSAKKRKFPQKLYDMIEYATETEWSAAVSWASDGRSFSIHDRDKLVDLLPHFFQHSKFSSFTRQLNLWGFYRITPESWRNENFERGNFDGLDQCQYVKVRGGSKADGPKKSKLLRATWSESGQQNKNSSVIWEDTQGAGSLPSAVGIDEGQGGMDRSVSPKAIYDLLSTLKQSKPFRASAASPTSDHDIVSDQATRPPSSVYMVVHVIEPRNSVARFDFLPTRTVGMFNDYSSAVKVAGGYVRDHFEPKVSLRQVNWVEGWSERYESDMNECTDRVYIQKHQVWSRAYSQV